MGLMKLNTIQKVSKLNEVYTADEIGPGGAHHKFIVKDANGGDFFTEINIQKGPRNDPESQHGVLMTDLLEIARNQLQGFQAGEYATEDNAEALKHLEIALMYLNKRTMDRYERDVLGTYQK